MDGWRQQRSPSPAPAPAAAAQQAAVATGAQLTAAPSGALPPFERGRAGGGAYYQVGFDSLDDSLDINHRFATITPAKGQASGQVYLHRFSSKSNAPDGGPSALVFLTLCSNMVIFEYSNECGPVGRERSSSW